MGNFDIAFNGKVSHMPSVQSSVRKIKLAFSRSQVCKQLPLDMISDSGNDEMYQPVLLSKSVEDSHSLQGCSLFDNKPQRQSTGHEL